MKAGVRVTAFRYYGTIHDLVMLNTITDDPAPRAAIEQASQMLKLALYKESKDVDNIAVVKKSAEEKLGVFPAYDYTVSFIKDGIHTKVKEMGSKYGDLEYIIVYWAQADRFDKYLPTIEKMINSFRVIYLPGE